MPVSLSMNNMKRYISSIALFALLLPSFAGAEENSAPPAPHCQVNDRACVLKEIENTAQTIDNQSWHDQTLRELAKTYAFENDIDKAVSLISAIKTPDTQAMTIRGIGMAAAFNKLSHEEYETIFQKLRKVAETITHPPSYAIALTYIAMGQAFAGENEGAWKTASEMENDALRHKAFGETAEIQAERGDYKSAMHSIEQIDSEAYRNKAYTTVSKILADHGNLQEALDAAGQVTNAYKKAEAMQYVLDVQKPRDTKKEDAGD
ncbi:MAG: hypothetical protein LRY54_04110 [Alphaproteobacteria bacterium]|nr:hypothetical protein [Alphaproteobacteria bacterium]